MIEGFKESFPAERPKSCGNKNITSEGKTGENSIRKVLKREWRKNERPKSREHKNRRKNRGKQNKRSNKKKKEKQIICAFKESLPE